VRISQRGRDEENIKYTYQKAKRGRKEPERFHHEGTKITKVKKPDKSGANEKTPRTNLGAKHKEWGKA
jgi:hypothetical protein